jgi:SET domain-containing protein
MAGFNDSFKKNLIKTKRGDRVIIIAKSDIVKDETIIEFRGSLLPGNKINKNDHYLQIAPDLYLSASGDFDDLISHSCSPNAYVSIIGQRAFLKAFHLIKNGTEISFDFSLTSTENNDEWKMKCSCGSFYCRKEISGYKTLSKEDQERYKKMGIVPEYIK